MSSVAPLHLDLGVSNLACFIQANPDVSGVGVRLVIYVQNLLCFVPAVWAIWDGEVSDYELESAETHSTTNLFLAFAILVSCIAQSLTHALTNYRATIVLSLSWMNNTNAFVYFLLYVQHKSQGGEGSIKPQLSAWAAYVLARYQGLFSIPSGLRVGRQPRPPFDNSVQTKGPAKDGVKILFKHVALFLGSLHLTLMAALGIWLWSNPQTFGTSDSATCATQSTYLTIMGAPVRFGSHALRLVSLAIYSIFLLPGFNLLLPMGLYLCLHCWYQSRRSEGALPSRPAVATGSRPRSTRGAGSRQHSRIPSPIDRVLSPPTPRHALHLQALSVPRPLSAQGSTLQTPTFPDDKNPISTPQLPRTPRGSPAPRGYPGENPTTPSLVPNTSSIRTRLKRVLPVCIGLAFLFIVNIIFITDIELTLHRNRGLQNSDESEWGFGQILAILLLFMPLRDLVEAIFHRNREMQTRLNGMLKAAIDVGDVQKMANVVSLGADPTLKSIHGRTALEVASLAKDWDLVRILVNADIDVNTALKGCRRYVWKTPLREACSNGQVQCAKRLIESQVKIPSDCAYSLGALAEDMHHNLSDNPNFAKGLRDIVRLRKAAKRGLSHYHGNRAMLLNSLAWDLLELDEVEGTSSHNDEAIRLVKQSLKTTPIHPPDRPYALDTLAMALRSKPGQLGEALALSREADSLMPDPHPVRWECKMSLATIFLCDYKRNHGVDTLEEATSACKEAVALCPQNHYRRRRLLDLELQKFLDPIRSTPTDRAPRLCIFLGVYVRIHLLYCIRRSV